MGTPDKTLQDFANEEIKCVSCSEMFTWSAGEQLFFHEKGLVNKPKRCHRCRGQKRAGFDLKEQAEQSGNGGKEKKAYDVNCAQCGAQTTVPFYPSQGRPVFCRPCFIGGGQPATA